MMLNVEKMGILVLNLIITGIPSIPKEIEQLRSQIERVLNLIITGIPSIPR